LIAKWEGDHLTRSGERFGEYLQLLCEVKDTLEGNIFNYLDDLPFTNLSQLFTSIRIHLEKKVNYNSEAFLPHTKKDYFSERDYLVNDLGLELKRIKSIIKFN
jgi:hypothetical protein